MREERMREKLDNKYKEDLELLERGIIKESIILKNSEILLIKEKKM